MSFSYLRGWDVQVTFEDSAAAELARSVFQRALVNNASAVFTSAAFLQAYGNPQVRLLLQQHGCLRWLYIMLLPRMPGAIRSTVEYAQAC